MLKKASHKVTNILLLFILLLTILLSFLVFKLIDNKKKETLRIENLISTFEKKFYNNSINTTYNNVSNDKVSQTIIDSIIKEYEEKLKFAYANFKIYSTNTNEINSTKSSSSSSSQQNSSKVNPEDNTYNNVTSYSKIKDFKPSDYTFKESKNTTNVTTYSKLKNNLDTNQNLTINSNTRKTNNSNNKIIHLNSALNSAKNINDITSSPIFPGCENQITERNKKNCLATKMSTYLMDNFNTNSFNHMNLKKGINNIRVIQIINKDGYSRLTKILGNWHPTVIKEVNRVINNMPKMKPGMNNNIKTPVKYSFKIPFIIN